MASFVAFSDGAEVIQRSLGVAHTSKTHPDLVHTVYEIDKCVDWIQNKGLTMVALQFPDELLGDAASVVTLLTELTTAKVFVLGDTSYGSCCVDAVAAEHNSADSLIHFGRACLSKSEKLPVLYVFTRLPIDVSICYHEVTKIIADASTPLLLIYDVKYNYVADELADVMKQKYTRLVTSKLDFGDMDPPCKNQKEDNVLVKKLGRTFELFPGVPLEDYTVIYLGEGNIGLVNWMMNLNKCRFCSYNASTCKAQIETLNLNKLLMKRYYMIEKAKDANIVGILAGTLGVKDHLAAMKRLKHLIKAAGKKSYTFVVGKLNVAKLANFAEIDVYVLVACPENTLIDSTEFYRPIVTPFEMEVACNQAREWTGDYYTDFRDLLPGAAGYVELSEDQSPTCDVSLVTGSVRTLGLRNDANPEDSGQVHVRNESTTLAHTAGDFLSQRSWKGLEENLGQTEVTKAVEGAKGIAASYSSEPT